MHGPLVSLFAGVAFSIGVRLGFCVLGGRRRERGLRFRFGLQVSKRVDRFIRGDIFSGIGGIRRRRRGTRTHHRFGLVTRERARLASPRGWRFGAFVLVIRLARRAARLLHLVVDHRDDGMVGDAALARAIVVENVTEADPALLHQLPRSDFFKERSERSGRPKERR